MVPSANPQYGNHLFLKRAPESGSGAAVALVSHLDTVFPAEEEFSNDFTWRVEGDRIYGPGSVDIKGGTVLIYMVLDILRRFAYSSSRTTCCANATEEVLSDEFAIYAATFPRYLATAWF
jgi:glutamate carboxypeptidase